MTLEFLRQQDTAADTEGEVAAGARQLRSGCLRLIAEALRRFPDAIDYGFLWPRLFVTAEPLMARLPTEASGPPPIRNRTVSLPQPRKCSELVEGTLLQRNHERSYLHPAAVRHGTSRA